MSIISRFFNFLLPHRCLLCGSADCSGQNLCPKCHGFMPWLKECCPGCSIPIAEKEGLRYCGQCLSLPRLYSKTHCLFTYEKPVSSLVTRLKFQHQLLIADLFGQLLAEKLKTCSSVPEYMIPVPLHPKRLRQRGFNQALAIAEIISGKLKIDIEKNSLIRTRHTRAQSDLPAKKRLANVKNAFECQVSLENRRVLLIDDVITTGNTIDACCAALKKAGAAEIQVCAVARTLFFQQ